MYKDALVRVPNPLGLRVTTNGVVLDPLKAEAYESRLDFRTGVWSVSWTQDARGSTSRIRVRTIVHPESSVIAQRLDVDSGSAARFEIWAGVKGARVAHGGNFERFEARASAWFASEREANQLGEIPPVRYIISNSSQGLEVDTWRNNGDGYIVEGQAFKFRLERVVAIETDEQAVGVPSFDEVERRAGEWWAEKWKTDIEIDGPVEDQQAIRSFMFYLYASANAKMPPMGMSSDKYKGHRFWDAEAWMLPVYALIDPKVAAEATKWRLRAMDYGGKIPWEAGCGGIDVTPAEFTEAIHVGGWVSWWIDKAIAFGLVSASEAEKLKHDIMQFFASRAIKRDGTIEFLEVMSPDEGRLRDNDLVTNVLSVYVARAGRGKKGSSFFWEPKIPRAHDGLPATYDRDHLVKYQQTAALLAVYPLEFFDETTQAALFDRYKDKVSDAGPAMSDSVHATIAARLGRKEEAYRFWKDAWRPFVRPGLMLFCERRGTDEAYFLTGAAGCLQSVIYGFLGCRIVDSSASREGRRIAPSKPLEGVYALAVRPNLPPEWRSITFKNIRLPTGVITIRASHIEAEIIEGEE